MPLPMEWPYAGTMRAAWSPSPEQAAALAVPLPPSRIGEELDRDYYHALMADRVAWMIRREEDPEEAAQQLAAEMEAASLFEGGLTYRGPLQASQVLIYSNTAMRQFLSQQLPDERNLKAESQPAAVEAILETSLFEWSGLLIPSLRSLD